jgi:hypothetical protein
MLKLCSEMPLEDIAEIDIVPFWPARHEIDIAP